MSEISLLTAIDYGKYAQGIKERAFSASENYFHINGKKAHVINFHVSDIDGQIRAELRDAEPSPLWKTALKVASYFTLIVPLIMGVVKIVHRLMYRGKLKTAPELAPQPEPEAPEVGTARKLRATIKKAVMQQTDIQNGYGEYIVFKRTENGKNEPVSEAEFIQLAHILDEFREQVDPEKGRYQAIKERFADYGGADYEIAFVPRTLYELVYLHKAIEEDLENGKVSDSVFSAYGGPKACLNRFLRDDEADYDWRMIAKELMSAERLERVSMRNPNIVGQADNSPTQSFEQFVDPLAQDYLNEQNAATFEKDCDAISSMFLSTIQEVVDVNDSMVDGLQSLINAPLEFSEEDEQLLEEITSPEGLREMLSSERVAGAAANILSGQEDLTLAPLVEIVSDVLARAFVTRRNERNNQTRAQEIRENVLPIIQRCIDYVNEQPREASLYNPVDAYAGVGEPARKINNALVALLPDDSILFSYEKIQELAKKEFAFFQGMQESSTDEAYQELREKALEITKDDRLGPIPQFFRNSSSGGMDRFNMVPLRATETADMGITDKMVGIYENAIALECSKEAQNAAILYRGGSLRDDVSLIKHGNPHSRSYGSGPLAGALFHGARSFAHHARADRYQNPDAYAIVVPYEELEASPFYFRKAHTIAELASTSELTHPRTKFWNMADDQEISGSDRPHTEFGKKYKTYGDLDEDEFKSNATQEAFEQQYRDYLAKAVLLSA